MAVATRGIRDAFAAHDAAVLGVVVARALDLPDLPAAARRPAAALRERLRDARDERALDAALATLPALTSVVQRWPTPDEPQAALAALPHEDDASRSWHDRRIIRFAAVVSVLRAMEEGPDSERGRELAATALVLATAARTVPGWDRRPARPDASSWGASDPGRRRPRRRRPPSPGRWSPSTDGR